MVQMLQSLGVGGVIAVVFMAASLIGMIVCAKKQNTSAIAKPMAVVLMIVVIVCAVVLLMKTGVLGDQGTQKIIANELTYAKAGYFILGKQLGEKAPGASTLLIVEKARDNDDRSPALLQAFKDGSAGKLKIAATATPSVTWPEGKQPKPEEMDMMPLNEMLKAKDYNDVINKYPDCTLIVSFIGLPNDVENLNVWSMPPDKRPKLGLINCAYQNLKNAIQSGAVLAVVGINPTAKFDEQPAPKEPKAAFDRRYIMITPENVVQIGDTYKNMFEPEKPAKKK
ncbi:MAG: hypothetical protein WC637_09765 [Victivallales bacterium]|jgi:hypothetical protein